MWEIQKTRHRMHLYWYKQSIQQCEILLANTGSIQDLNPVPLSLVSAIKSLVSPTQHSGQTPFPGTEEMGWPSTAERDAAPADALAAVQQIT